MHTLRKGGVAYINVDGCTSGDAFDGEASPALKDSVIDALKSTPYQSNQHNSYMNEYFDNRNNENLDEKDKEKELLDSDSTYYDHWSSILRQVFYYHFNSI